MVEFVVAIDEARVRFTDDAFIFVLFFSPLPTFTDPETSASVYFQTPTYNYAPVYFTHIIFIFDRNGRLCSPETS